MSKPIVKSELLSQLEAGNAHLAGIQAAGKDFQSFIQKADQLFGIGANWNKNPAVSSMLGAIRTIELELMAAATETSNACAQLKQSLLAEPEPEPEPEAAAELDEAEDPELPELAEPRSARQVRGH